MKRLLLFCLFIAILNTYVKSQNKKSVTALSIDSPLIIDGILNEQVYKNTSPANNFVQLQPLNGEPSFQPSEVFLFYDQNAVYVGAMLHDSNPDSIFNYLTERDHIGMADYFGIYFDPYNEGQLAYGFFVNVAGVQTDLKAIKKEYDYEDDNWNAVWESKTKITDRGWVVEMRIPYSALRFPEKEIHTWGLNMFRNIRRYNSNNSWNFIDREVSGFIHQQGELTGIENITPPVRLSFSPYAATYLEYSDATNSPQFIYKGGMDLKYGINESFTLDMMLIPDFGQIQSDDEQLNLSPYELYYDEKRQFFNEGTELFDRGNIFYSRRIGSAPHSDLFNDDELGEHEVITKPTETQLVNATKISGRQRNGFAIGVLNAISLKSYGDVKDTTTNDTRTQLLQPLTNYNVSVIDQTMKNNSYVSLINTNMSVANNPFMANVTATEFQLRDKTKTYAISGKGGVSHRGADEKETGFFGIIAADKNNGKLNYGVAQRIWSNKYNPNDMGYLRRNNELITSIYSDYNINKPFSIFREMHMGTWWDYYRSYNPNASVGHQLGFYMNGLFKNNFWFNWNVQVKSDQYDYFEPRVAGRYYYKTPSTRYNVRLRTDNRKRLSGQIRFGNFNRPDPHEYAYWGEIEIDWRIGQRLDIEYEIEIKKDINDKGHVNSDDENFIYFSNRDITTVVNGVEVAFAFNNKLSMQLRTRHYWSGVENKSFYQLTDDGRLNPETSYSEDNTNFNAFNIDMTMRWVFAPGSEMSFAWKNAILTDEIAKSNKYKDNFNIIQNSPATNTISLKVLYYIDYNQLRKKH